MPLKLLIPAACSLLASLCLTADPVQADTAPKEITVPKSTKPDSNGVEDSDIHGIEDRVSEGDPAPASNATAFQTREPRHSSELPDYKSVGAACAWSILGTAAPMLLASQLSDSPQGESDGLTGSLILGGLLVGPSLGQFYAGSPVGGFLGFGIRGAGGFMTVLGFIHSFWGRFCSGSEDESCGENNAGSALLTVGVLTYVGGTLYSLIDAGRAVERHNDRQNQSRVFGWSPTFAPTPQGGVRTGALAYFRF